MNTQLYLLDHDFDDNESEQHYIATLRRSIPASKHIYSTDELSLDRQWTAYDYNSNR